MYYEDITSYHNNMIHDKIKRWLFPVTTFIVMVTALFPFFFNVNYYVSHLNQTYGVVLDIIVLMTVTLCIYFKKYEMSLVLSFYFILHVIFSDIPIINIQKFVIFDHIFVHNTDIFQVFYYFIPLALFFVLYNQWMNEKTLQSV